MHREGVGGHRSPLHWSRFLYIVLLAGLVAAGLYCGFLAYTTLREFAANTQFRSIPLALFLPPTPQPEQEPQGIERSTFYPSAPEKEIVVPQTETKERVNVLIMGIDQRPGESTACRTDTMMLVSINPKDMSVSILSIPRDLWVEIPHPGHDKDRINTAHYWGEEEDYPGGGPALAKKTVEYNFGVRVHYYARLNFTGFERIIDTIGGIDVDVPVTIDDHLYPAPDNSYTTIHIPAGMNHFDGEMALKYARTRRGTGDGDFTRMERQQQVILAIRDRVLSIRNLPQLIRQAPKLLHEMGDSLETDMPLEEMLVLAEWARQVKSENILSATINRDLTTDWQTPDGEAVLVYDRARARPVIDALFSDPTPQAEITQTSPAGGLEAEGARIAVYNGTTVNGLAARVRSFLEIQGIDVVRVDNADRHDYERTTLQVYGNAPTTAKWLAGWLADIGVAEPNVEHPLAPGDADIILIIGKDFPAEKID